MNSECISYKKYFSLREKSFIEEFTSPLLTILKIIVKYANKVNIAAIINHFLKKENKTSHMSN